MNRFLKSMSVIASLIFLEASFAVAADQVYFYYTDPAGTPLAMADTSGTVVWKADYMPFGEETVSTSTVDNNKTFVGKEKDSETGLHYFGARYMESMAGRFLTPDPIASVASSNGKINQKALANPQALNVYAYSLNNPYKYVDKDGAWPERIHNKLIDQAFSKGDYKLNANIIGIFKQASAYADSADYQAAKFSYMHSMSTTIYSEEMAAKFTTYYVEGKIAEYKRLMAEGNWVATDKANYAIGMAMHAVMDSTAPSHENYQSWGGLEWLNPLSWIKGAEHGLLEQYANSSKKRETVRMLRDLHNRANQ